jgi:hypothetical protein
MGVLWFSCLLAAASATTTSAASTATSVSVDFFILALVQMLQMLKDSFEIGMGVGIGEMMSGKEFCENSRLLPEAHFR